MKESIQLVQDNEHVINEKAFRKENVKKLLSNLRCIDVATNILNLNMERARSNQRYLKAKEHSSMVFDLKSNRVFWNARTGSQPLNVVDFYCEYNQFSKAEGLAKLLDFYYTKYDGIDKDIYLYDEELEETYRQKEFVLPIANENNQTVIDYLTHKRCLDKDLVEDLINKHLLFEDTFHNAVFISYDLENKEKPVFGCRRGTGETKFQLDVYGSNKQNGFFYKCPIPTDTLVVTEAVIDGLSYATLTKDNPNAHILASSGCGCALSTLKYNLKNNEELKDIKKIRLMLDLDDAGKTASNKIIEAYKNKSLFKISENESIEEKAFDIKSVKFNLKGHEQLKINDLNQLLQVKHYYEENARKKEIMKEHPERYTVLKVHDSYDSKNEPVENEQNEEINEHDAQTL